jgi:hypothetical protein
MHSLWCLFQSPQCFKHFPHQLVLWQDRAGPRRVLLILGGEHRRVLLDQGEQDQKGQLRIVGQGLRGEGQEVRIQALPHQDHRTALLRHKQVGFLFYLIFLNKKFLGTHFVILISFDCMYGTVVIVIKRGCKSKIEKNNYEMILFYSRICFRPPTCAD